MTDAQPHLLAQARDMLASFRKTLQGPTLPGVIHIRHLLHGHKAGDEVCSLLSCESVRKMRWQDYR